jgi:hypothetical protein
MSEHLEQMWATRRRSQGGGLLHKPTHSRGAGANKYQNSMEHVYRTLTSHYNIACQQVLVMLGFERALILIAGCICG